MRDGHCLGFAMSGAFHFTRHLTKIQFGNYECFDSHRQLRDLFIREGPRSDEAQLADF
jgi:hypothetical protein